MPKIGVCRTMQLFECDACRQPLYFENRRCLRCGHALGFDPARMKVIALERDGHQLHSLADKAPFRLCGNAEADACNWLIPADLPDTLCPACTHNRTIPDLSQPGNPERWQRLERAKHHLLYSIRRLRLPTNALVFDFVADRPTGHADGVITVNIAEADDVERERTRTAMGEPYRTLLGHFRHEIGHYYWDRLVRDRDEIASFRALFGDERTEYEAALRAYYADGAPADWKDRHVSLYAASHPWEDFAETWAHYLHIVDTLETAAAFGVQVRPQISRAECLEAAVDFDPYLCGSATELLASWLPISYALNSLNRSMGQPDLYPFVLSPVVERKLDFIIRIATALNLRGTGCDRARSLGRRTDPSCAPRSSGRSTQC